MKQTNAYLKWLSGTDSVYWHDSALPAEQEIAFANGAVGMTTNPFLINRSVRGDAGFWRKELSGKLDRSVELPEALTGGIVSYYSQKLKPLYDTGEFASGYVCAQTDPNCVGDYCAMMEQALRYAAIGENVVLKIPATRAGIAVIEECTARGLHTAATLNMTVSGVLAVAEARERGIRRAEANGIRPGLGIAVLMLGRLDNYIRDVAHDTEAGVSEEDVVQCGVACFKRAYQIFMEKEYRTWLMPAGCFTVNSITEIAGAKMIMSVSPAMYDLLSGIRVYEERIGFPVDQAVTERLLTVEEFRKAYEPGALEVGQLIGFGGTNRTTAQYIECGWNPMREIPEFRTDA